MKVLFLDIDGVLKDDNYIRYVNNHFDEFYLIIKDVKINELILQEKGEKSRGEMNIFVSFSEKALPAPRRRSPTGAFQV